MCVDLDEEAHFEPPHQEFHCLLIPLFLSLALKVLITQKNKF